MLSEHTFISFVYGDILICFTDSTLNNISLRRATRTWFRHARQRQSHFFSRSKHLFHAKFQPGKLTTNCHVPYASGCMALLPIADLTALANSRLFSSSERVSMIVYIFGRTSRDTASGFASYDDPNVVPACAQSLLCLLLDTTFIIVTLNIGGSHVRHNINKVLL